MITIQKFEIVSGISTFLLTLRISYMEYLFAAKGIAESSYFYREGLVVIIIPALLVAIGAYLHTTKQKIVSISGFLMLSICGGWLSLIYFVNFTLGRTSNIYPLLYVLPGLFAVITVFLAIINTMLLSGNNSEQPRRKKM